MGGNEKRLVASTSPPGGTAVLVLAAGAGSRMRQAKQLLLLGDRSVLGHVVEAALASDAEDVVVVVGHAADEIYSVVGDFDGRVRYVHNRQPDRGLSSSLAVGLSALDRATDAAVVLLGDQPGVTADAVAQVVAGFRAAADALAARAVYCDGECRVPGHPVVLGRALWAEVASQTGDVGARLVLERHAARVAEVELAQSPPPDLDVPEDYAAALRQFRAP